ncbi:MAG: hypothetical protein ACRC2U_01395 [Aeromonas sp.]
MATESKRKIIHYKRAVISNCDLTLQNILENLLLKTDAPTFKATARKEMINADADYCRLINRNKQFHGMFFGQLVFFEPGKSQTFITLDEDAEFYNISSLTSESIKDDDTQDASTLNREKLRKEFINSILYFGVFDNHVVILQSAALRARELETHLVWFLGSCTDSISTESILILKDKPTEETLKKIQSLPVKTVRLGAPVGTYEEITASSDTKDIEAESSTRSELKAKNIKWAPKGAGFDVIRALMDAGLFEKVNLDDALDDANFKVSLEISYIRKTTINGQKMIDNIATSMRHMDESDVRIELQGGGTLKGEDLKLSGPISVQTIDGLVDENDLYRQMHAWLRSKVDSNELEVTGEEEA